LYAARPEYIHGLADSHAPIYEQVEEFNARTLAFLLGHA
jgi:hypothetical protein